MPPFGAFMSATGHGDERALSIRRRPASDHRVRGAIALSYRVSVHRADHDRVLTWLDLYELQVLADIDIGNGYRRLDIDGPADAIDQLCVATDLADVAIAITVVDGGERTRPLATVRH